jgi:hypothetical protein
MTLYKSLDDQIMEVIQYINSIDNFTFDINGFSILGGHLAVHLYLFRVFQFQSILLRLYAHWLMLR